MINLAILLEESAREVPERTAIIFDETRLSYAAVNAAANQVANVLAQAGIHKGETVALTLPGRYSPPFKRQIRQLRSTS